METIKNRYSNNYVKSSKSGWQSNPKTDRKVLEQETSNWDHLWIE